jgi:hypothetical protein
MAIKSSLYDWFWWIPTSELEDENPTAFLMRQMSKKDKDVAMNKKQGETILSSLLSETDEEEVGGRLKRALEKQRTEAGFDSSIYGSCIKEIRNIYVKGELVESITEKQQIVEAVAGLVDQDASIELDDALWRISTLTEVEKANFTPSSGCSVVYRTVRESQTKKK